MNSKTKRITVIGMLCAITYVTMVVGRIPIILFLKYDPSDVIVTLGGFIWGPMTSCIVSVIVATLEMITVSDTGILGCIMNIVQTLSFACTASVIYKKKHTLSGAVIGLASGWLITVIVIWKNEYYSKKNNTITVHIRHLREKMKDSFDEPRYIKTIWGCGYKIEK